MSVVISGLWDRTISSLGAQALSDGMRAKLAALWPDKEVVELRNENLFTGCSTLIRLFDGKKVFYPVLFTILGTVYQIRFLRRVRAIRKSELLIINGDGIVGDQFTYHTALLALDLRMALKSGVKCVSLNQSINVTRGSFAHYCVKRYFLQCPVSVREAESLHYLQEEFGRHDVVLSLDSAFLVPPLDAKEISRYDEALSSFRSRYGFEEYVMVGVRANRPRWQIVDTRAWAEVIRAAAEIFQCSILLASSTPEYDIPLARRLSKLSGLGIVIEELMNWQKYDYRFFLYLVARALASVSDRYHQNVFAALVGTPFVPVEGNTTKTLGLQFLLPPGLRVLPVPSVSNLNSYHEALRLVWQNNQAIRAHLRDSVTKLKSTHDRYEELLKAALSRPPTGLSIDTSCRMPGNSL
ncbi:MAG: polysaccharide pyruvyl transferase family protein [Kiritimatiellae bacterium]|nr:polysaccharide pyruvyl transferase family protein [Kiritimatiellia bacterium]